MIRLSLALCALGAAPVLAQDVSCRAETQCRGDARTLCAPSDLEIRVRRGPGGIGVWLDGTGPYPATQDRADGMTRYRMEHFGGDYAITIDPVGRFSYRGNRAKTFTGQCEDAS